jgi:hypothetical protein
MSLIDWGMSDFQTGRETGGSGSNFLTATNSPLMDGGWTRKTICAYVCIKFNPLSLFLKR